MKALIPVLILLLFPAGIAWSENLEEVTKSLVADIQDAKRQLVKEQSALTHQQNKLVDEIHKNATEVAKLRAQAAAATRQQDEQLLDIKQLSERLHEWQSQENYQQQVLLDLQPIITPNQNDTVGSELSPVEALTQLNRYISVQRSALTPSITSEQLVLPSGDVIEANTLQLGPVSWFYDANKEMSGLLNTNTKLASVSHVFSDEAHAQLVNVFQGEPGMLTFDPTLDQLLKMAQHEETVADHLQKGGVWAVPILLFAGFALLIGLVKAATLFRLPTLQPLFSERLSLIQSKAGTHSELKRLHVQLKDAQRELVNITLEHQVSQQRDDQLFAYLMGYRHRLERGIGAIALVASISPLLGLLGTVSGMIETFRMMTLFGAGDPSAVSGGISEALVTTELGLIVAIPALILHAILNRRVKSRCITLEAQAIQLSQIAIPELESQPVREHAA